MWRKLVIITKSENLLSNNHASKNPDLEKVGQRKTLKKALFSEYRALFFSKAVPDVARKLAENCQLLPIRYNAEKYLPDWLAVGAV